MHLTKNEEIVMNVIWNEKVPLTSMEILGKCANERWDHTYILHMLRALEKKALVEVCGTVRSGKQYARQFRAAMTKEGYALEMVLQAGVGAEGMLWIASELEARADHDRNTAQKPEETRKE